MKPDDSGASFVPLIRCDDGQIPEVCRLEKRDISLVPMEKSARRIDINLNGVLYGMRYQIPVVLRTGARDCAIVQHGVDSLLLSDEASFMTGGYYLVDGGYTAV